MGIGMLGEVSQPGPREVGMPEKGWVCQREVVGFPEAKVRVDVPGGRVWICIIR